jgi:hypothetical protein
MSWIRKSPFQTEEEAAEQIVDLLAAEAEFSGFTLSPDENNLLSTECPIPGDLREKSKNLIQRVLLKETREDSESPISFGSSLMWAGDVFYPNVVRLTEEVVIEGRAAGILPQPPIATDGGCLRTRQL